MVTRVNWKAYQFDSEVSECCVKYSYINGLVAHCFTEYVIVPVKKKPAFLKISMQVS